MFQLAQRSLYFKICPLSTLKYSKNQSIKINNFGSLRLNTSGNIFCTSSKKNPKLQRYLQINCVFYAHTWLRRKDTANLSKPFVILSCFKPRRCWEGGRCKACKTLQYIEPTHTKVKLLVAHPPAISEVRPKLLTLIFQAMKL